MTASVASRIVPETRDATWPELTEMLIETTTVEMKDLGILTGRLLRVIGFDDREFISHPREQVNSSLRIRP